MFHLSMESGNSFEKDLVFCYCKCCKIIWFSIIVNALVFLLLKIHISSNLFSLTKLWVWF